MKNRTIILITGSSRGIGEEIVRHAEQNGHIVYGSSRTPPANASRNHITLDVTNISSCERAVEKILAEQGRIDVLINNAGFHLTGAAQENSLEEIHAQMDINFYGAVNMTKSVLPIFLEQQSGKIINVSSIGGLLSLPYTSAYNASKFALEGYMEALRLELAPLRIFVSNLEPGYVNSGTIDQSIGKPATAIPLFARYREQLHRIMEEESLKGTPKDSIAKTIQTIICSPKPNFRYTIGRTSKILPLMKALIPQGSFENIVLRSFGLPLTMQY